MRPGAARDVPPPRPVVGEPVLEPAGGGLGRAAQVIAEAVAGLLDQGAGGSAKPAGRAAAGVLTDVVGAVAGLLKPGAAPGGQTSTVRGRVGGGVLTDLLSAAVPRLPIRDGARLRAAHPGATTSEIADALVTRSIRMTSAIGMAVGGVSAASWFAPPTLLALPIELGTETVLVAAVEVVLIGELHELYGRAAPGDARARASAYLASWSTQRAVGAESGGRFAALGAAGLGALRRRLTRRLIGNTTSAAPLLIGAALGARSNRKGTEKLAGAVLTDLRTALPPGH